MSAYTGKAVVTSAKITFAGVAYDCKSIPSGIPELRRLCILST